MSCGFLPAPGRRIPVARYRHLVPRTAVVVIIVLTIKGWAPEPITTILIALGLIPVLSAVRAEAP